MTRDDFESEVLALPVWDTHNHLEGSEALCAQSFWDLVHYFWFHRELQGVGYPSVADAMALPEGERAEAYARAFHVGRNTTWNRLVRRTLKDLWDAEITDGPSVLAAGAKMVETGGTAGWAAEVCGRLNLATICVERIADNGLQEISDRLHIIRWFRMPGEAEIRRMLESGDPAGAAEARAEEIRGRVDELAAEGIRVVRTDTPSGTDAPELSEGASADDASEYLRHALFRALDEKGFHVQVFVGMARPTPNYELRTRVNPSYALNDPARIARMHDVFDMYAGCTFEIVNAAQLSNLDIVQAARIYPNVYPGGLWWFNFRASNYREIMQYRLEALPATRCTLLASDARCLEWAYCKTLLVKRLLAEFLWGQIERGWIDRDAAMYVAREWLHDAAARVYCG